MNNSQNSEWRKADAYKLEKFTRIMAYLGIIISTLYSLRMMFEDIPIIGKIFMITLPIILTYYIHRHALPKLKESANDEGKMAIRQISKNFQYDTFFQKIEGLLNENSIKFKKIKKIDKQKFNWTNFILIDLDIEIRVAKYPRGDKGAVMIVRIAQSTQDYVDSLIIELNKFIFTNDYQNQ